MTRQPPKTTYLDQWLKPEHFVFWQGRIYQVERPAEAEADPLTIWLRDVDSTELKDVRVEQLLLSPRDDGQMAPLFAPSLEKLRAAIQEPQVLTRPVPEASLPEKLLQRADKVIDTVETIERLVREQERLARLLGETMPRAMAIKQACQHLAEPLSRSTYYIYRHLYRQYDGDRRRIAAAFRRKTFNQTKMSQAQLHFMDTLILRFYAGKRSLRLSPRSLYKLAYSTLKRTEQQWLDPAKCPGEGVEHVVEELLDPRLPMSVILANREKAGWLTPINLPSLSWFYGYLRWFEAQPDQGQEIMVTRYGQERWEQEYMVFDTFVSRAVRPLEYVFADHWLIDVFIVDEATRSRLDRLWLTVLVDAYSRSVVGLALLYEVPCIESIQSALRHAIWPKVSHRELGLQGEWVCYGIPQQLYLDNAWAHHSFSLEQLSRAISQGGRYNSIDLVFRPPYRGRYGALIERLFGNFSGQMKELLAGAIQSSRHQDVTNATHQACLLYQDIYLIVHQLILRYQHTPHRELAGLSPHQKWLEGWQLGYSGWPPPLTDELERLFWRPSSESRVIHSKGISAFGMHYWSPALAQAPRKALDGQPVYYHFSYEPADISRLAIFRERQWVGDVFAKQLRRADGSTRAISLWERHIAQAIARDRGRASQDWLMFVTELDELNHIRAKERKQAQRQAKHRSEPGPSQTTFEQLSAGGSEPDYTELLVNFVSDPVSGGTK